MVTQWDADLVPRWWDWLTKPEADHPECCGQLLPGYFVGRDYTPVTCNRLPHNPEDAHVRLVPPPRDLDLVIPFSPSLYVEWWAPVGGRIDVVHASWRGPWLGVGQFTVLQGISATRRARRAEGRWAQLRRGSQRVLHPGQHSVSGRHRKVQRDAPGG